MSHLIGIKFSIVYPICLITPSVYRPINVIVSGVHVFPDKTERLKTFKCQKRQSCLTSLFIVSNPNRKNNILNAHSHRRIATTPEEISLKLLSKCSKSYVFHYCVLDWILSIDVSMCALDGHVCITLDRCTGGLPNQVPTTHSTQTRTLLSKTIICIQYVSGDVECLRKVLIGSRNGFDYEFTLERNQCSIK